MFTTQEKIKYLLPFSATHPFFDYCGPDWDDDTSCGRTRHVKLWDEAFIPIDPVVISLDQIDAFANRLIFQGQRDAARVLKAWIVQLQSHNPEFDKVPEWLLEVPIDDLSNEDVFKTLMGDTEEQRAITDAMMWLQGQEVKIIRQAYAKNTVSISYRQSVPYDIEPLMIFDAGGGDAEHYALMKRKLGNVIKLPSVQKTFRNMTIRFFDQPSGQAAYRVRANIEELANVAAQAVCEKPSGEHVLIFHRLGKKAPASILPGLISQKVRALGGDVERLHFKHWGDHKWTNEFKDVKHIIAVGVHQAPLSKIIGMVYGMSRKPMHATVNPSAIELMRMSQIVADLNQGIGRGATRQFINEDVPEGCTVDIIASSWGPMRFANPIATLQRMFPDATVKQWLPNVSTTKPANEAPVIEAAITLLGTSPCIEVTDKEWGKAAGVAGRTVRRRLNEGLAELLADRGLTIEGREVRGSRGGKPQRTTLIKKT
jgi:hypothetical protein